MRGGAREDYFLKIICESPFVLKCCQWSFPFLEFVE